MIFEVFNPKINTMAELDPTDFRDAIDDMCDSAVRRLYAMQEGGLTVMIEGDEYVSVDISHDRRLNTTTFVTRTRAIVIDSIHEMVFDQGAPEYVLELLSGATIALARHSARRSPGSSVYIPNTDTALAHAKERMTVGSGDIDNGHEVSIARHALGSLGLVDLCLRRDESRWSLLYEANRQAVLVRE